MKDIGRTRDAADWQKWPDAKARRRVSFTRGFSRRHCTRHLDSIAPSLGVDGMEAIGAISDGRCREKVARWDGQQPLGQLVCVGVTAESGGDGGGEGKGEVPQPWHDALLKIGNALIMMFCGGSEHVNSTSHHLCLGSGAWDLGPRWRSFPWESQRTVAMHPTSSR